MQEEDYSIDKFLSAFEDKAQKDENGVEFWYARDLQHLLSYSASWQNFQKVIEKAKISCNTFGQLVDSHFNDFIKMVESGVAPVPIQDFKLTRYACYLIAQNGDSKKKPVAFAQTYFAVQTRRQELEDVKLNKLSENNKRIHLRQEIKKHNSRLSSVAKNAGVIEPLDHAVFQNFGYKGLYNGKTKQDIATHKGLSKKDDILDHMGSEELGANIFRITQTAAKIERENIQEKELANKTHFEVGKKIRQTIQEIGGIMPEDLPTAESIERIKQEHRRLERAKKKVPKPEIILE